LCICMYVCVYIGIIDLKIAREVTSSFIMRRKYFCLTTLMFRMWTLYIEGKWIVHTFEAYTKLEAVGVDDYFYRLESSISLVRMMVRMMLN